jgi:hypothetical protein
VPTFGLSAAHRLRTEIFVLAARWDEAVDYRTSIALAYIYPRHELFIADDNHLFSKLSAGGLHRRLVQTFLEHGLESAELRGVINSAQPYRWKEMWHHEL